MLNMRTLKASLPSDPLNEVEINSSDLFTVCMWYAFLWKLSFIIYDLFFHAQFHQQTHFCLPPLIDLKVEPSWNVMAHGDAQEGNWRGNWRIEWVASTLHTTSEHGVSSITTADAHTSAASSQLNRRPRQFKWTRPFCLKTKSGFCACAIAFQMQATRYFLS